MIWLGNFTNLFHFEVFYYNLIMGRPTGSVGNTPGFTIIEISGNAKGEKKVYNAICHSCQKQLTNTAQSRLLGHK